MDILAGLLPRLAYRDHPVRAVWSCAFWTLVTTKYSGLSSTFRGEDLQHSDHAAVTVPDAGRLLEKTAGELADYALSDDTVTASIGMAAINSMLDVDESKCVERGALDLLLEKGRGRTIGVVGHFGFVPKLREAARKVWVIEQRPRPGDIPATQAAEILPACDVVCLTASSFINHTIEQLLTLCAESYVVLTGPTAPLIPQLFECGIDAICGTRVTDAAEVLRHISQGACFKQVRGHGVRLLTMIKG
ncbi:MAG: DUF364 domain-containing protein [Verrucomicrobia bacterium]|nr:DUF364 domain-containing protein [Verrucomicrobiota bacterium]MBU1909642.1 DUF364 domain-containing protein [Verrucomicrobiota bacterium]